MFACWRLGRGVEGFRVPETVGEAAIRIVADASSLAQDIQKQSPGPLIAAGDRMAGAIGRALKRGLKVTAASIAGILGYALVKGFGRLKAIDDARGKLTGLGHDAKSVEKVMASALASVKGTAFGLGDAATVAASAVAAGVKPGAALTRTLKLVADSATISGTSMSDLGAIFNKVASTGKVQGEVLKQLGERGIPILQFLGKELGKTPAEVAKLASAGKIGFATFQNAMERGLGGAALASGTTFTGALENVKAALGRLGANVLQGVFGQMPGLFAEAIAGLDTLGDHSKVIGERIGASFTTAVLALKLFASSDGAQQFMALLVQAGRDLVGVFLNGVVPMFVSLKVLLPVVGAAIGGAAKLLGFLADHGGLVQVVLWGLIGAYVGWKLAVAAANIVLAANTVIMMIVNKEVGKQARELIVVRAATLVWAAAQWVLAAGLVAASAAQRVLNAAMKANPIGFIIGLVALLVGGIILLWKHNETFRTVVLKVWAAIKTAVGAVYDWFVATLLPGLRTVWDGIAAGARIVGSVLATVWSGVVTGITWLWTQLTVITTAINAIIGTVVGAFVAFGQKVGEVALAIYGFYFTWIRPVFELLGALTVLVWQTFVKPALQAMINMWVSVGNWFRSVFTTVIAVTFGLFKTAFTAVGNLVKWVWTNLIMPVIGLFIYQWQLARAGFTIVAAALQTVWRAVGTGFRWVYDTLIVPVVNLFKTAWNLVRSAFSVVTNGISAAWSSLSGKLRSVYDKTISPVMAVFRSAAGKLKDAFDTAAAGIAKAWNKIKDAALSPVKFVIETVINNGLIDGFNKIARAVGTTTLPRINLPKGFHGGGPTPNIGNRRVAGVVHGNEHVVTDREVRRTPGGHRTWERLRDLALHGHLPGYFLGGGVQPVPGSGHRHSGYGWARWAGDFPVATNTPARAYKAGQVSATKLWNHSYGKHVRVNHGGEQTLYAHLNRILVKVGQQVARAQTLGLTDSTGNSTGPHLHFELKGGSGRLDTGTGGDGTSGPIAAVIDWVGRIKRALTGPIDKLKSLGTSTFATMVKAVPKRLVSGMVNKIRGKAGDAAASGAGVPLSGGNQAIGRQMLLRMGFPGSQWSPLQKLWTRESGWRTTARNPGSGAYGIPQSLPGSKMASAGSDWRTNPQTQIAWGLRYIKQRYGSPAAAWGHSQRTGWYDNGGLMPPGYGSYFNGTRKPEVVLTDSQWSAMSRLADHQTGPGNVYVDMNVTVDDLNKMGQIGDFLDMLSRSRVNARRTQRSGTVPA